jgi:hypothetical protein
MRRSLTNSTRPTKIFLKKKGQKGTSWVFSPTHLMPPPPHGKKLLVNVAKTDEIMIYYNDIFKFKLIY